MEERVEMVNGKQGVRKKEGSQENVCHPSHANSMTINNPWTLAPWIHFGVIL